MRSFLSAAAVAMAILLGSTAAHAAWPVAQYSQYTYPAGSGAWTGFLFVSVGYTDADSTAGRRILVSINGVLRYNITGGWWSGNFAPGTGTIRVDLADVDASGKIIAYRRGMTWVQ